MRFPGFLEPKADDLVLARRAASGDQRALESLYGRYSGVLHAYIAHRLNGSGDDVEDIWQETLLAAVRSLATYDGRSRFFTWLCGIAGHKIADHLRRAGKSPELVFSDLPPEQLLELADSGPLPDEILASGDVRLRVVKALGNLPQEYRRALVMRYAQECSVDEVAQSLGKGYKAAESLLARARNALRTLLSEEA
jgi:RNA polymerase sigma-70 factor (ECF subfamily)